MENKRIAKVMVEVAEKAARKAVCKASPWNHYQPKESAEIRRWARSAERD